MSKAAKKIASVVVSIAVPFVAPKIVAAFAASSVLKGTALGAALSSTAGATIGSAVVGAGLGAIGAKATGQDVGRGALFGALGGGIGGFTSAQAAASQTAANAVNAANATADPIAAMNASQGWTAADPTYLQQINATQGVGPGAATGAGAVTSGSAAATGQTGTFMSALSKLPGEIAAKFADPKVLADMTLRAGASILTGQLAGDGLSPEEQQLLRAQTQELQQLRERDEELFQIRLREAQELLGEARYFDPERYGLQEQARMQVAGAQQQRETQRAAALQPGRMGMSAADERRAGLDITARGQTAYLQGAEAAQRNRLATYQAGLGALPTQGPGQVLNYGSNLSNMYADAERRRREAQNSIGQLFGSITGRQDAQSLG